VADPNCTFEQAIEMIDIGGPCMLRAAAKNYKHVLILSDACHYKRTLKYLRGDTQRLGKDWPSWLMSRGFQCTASYDCSVYSYFAKKHWDTPFPPVQFLELVCALHSLSNELRYGENPHQRGTMCDISGEESISTLPSSSMSIEDAEPSFNNYADGHAALELCKELTRELRFPPSCVFIKHTNACGVGLADSPIDAYRRTYLGDPNAAMGGVLACTFKIDADFAKIVMETYGRFGKAAGAGGFFVEVWIAPAFDDDALEIIRTTKKWGERVRLLTVGDMSGPPDETELEYRSISGGMLVQTRDMVGLNEDQWKVVTKRQPSDQELNDLRLAWLVCKHTKSNAITICKDNMLIGNGAGQMSRVMSCRIATWLAQENGHEAKLVGSVAASDAFFPFPDGPSILMDAGVSAIIQPGGSKRDDETIKICDKRGVAMIMTGTRHFKH
jgi:phosphoribosylaminoimidazolecarboxamide formyltransferase/IMP cyclohydrolase